MIRNLPFHVGILQSAVHISYAVLKLKTYAYIKEVIILDILNMFTCNTYYNPSPTSREVLYNIFSVFCIP